jgi:hypothetical protein
LQQNPFGNNPWHLERWCCCCCSKSSIQSQWSSFSDFCFFASCKRSCQTTKK